MGFHFARPSLLLSPYIKQYWGIENCLSPDEVHIQRIVPNGLMELMFYLGDKPVVLDNKKQFNANTIISGQQRRYYDLKVSDKLSLFSITFQPYAAKMFFDIPAGEFCDQNLPLKLILKDKVSELENAMFERATFEERVVVAENFLLNQLQHQNGHYQLDRIVNSISLINQSRGIIDIESLSSSACLCRKQFERTFSEYIGASPKHFLRTIRFQNSLHEKQRNKEIQLTELAYRCGYYDQSHMINDFKLLSGKTPTQYFSECEPYSDYFQ